VDVVGSSFTSGAGEEDRTYIAVCCNGKLLLNIRVLLPISDTAAPTFFDTLTTLKIVYI
jgi:hypothetical protein